jgi:endonuclease YncB( thermonuclease family)
MRPAPRRHFFGGALGVVQFISREPIPARRAALSWSIVAMATFLVVAVLGAGCAGGGASNSTLTTVTIAGVTYGDAIRLTDGSTMRLPGIDAPNGRDCHALLSRRTLARLLPPGTVVTIADGYVFKDSVNVSLLLVRSGAASAYFGRRPSPYARQILRSARRAKEGRRGAWGGCAATLDPAHVWRLQRRAPDRIVRNG